MTVELRHLRAFLAIAEEGGITRAAARLGTGQPVVSRTLRRLEDHMGVLLVDRSTHHLELTRAGRAFLDRARAAVAAADAALDPAGLVVRPLRLGHSWAALGDETAVLLRRWDEEHPDVPLELLRIDDRCAGLARGRVDVALLRAPAADCAARTELLRTEARVAAVPADSPLAAPGRGPLTLADLAHLPLAVNPVSGVTTPALWPQAHRPRRTVEVANTDDWLAAIAAGRAVGVTTTATAQAHRHHSVAYVPLTGAPAVPLVLAWRDPPGHPAVPALLTLAHRVAGEHAREPKGPGTR